MKKKKLKKKIKQLKRQLDSLKTSHHNVALKVSSLQELRENMEDTIDHLDELDELVTDIENKPKDNRINILWEWLQRSGIDFHDLGKTPTYAEEVVYTEDIQRQINEINNRLRILDSRTRTDYTMYGAEGQVIKFNEDHKNEKTCDTCDWLGQSGCGPQCVECPANNKKGR